MAGCGLTQKISYSQDISYYKQNAIWLYPGENNKLKFGKITNSEHKDHLETHGGGKYSS